MALRRVAQSLSRPVRFQGVLSAWHDNDDPQGDDKRQQQPILPGQQACHMALALQGSISHAWPEAQAFAQPTRGMAWWSRKPAPQPPAPASELQPDLPEATSQPELPLDTSTTEVTSASGLDGVIPSDTAVVIEEACSQVESVAIQAARDESVLLGSQFILGLQAAHDQLGLPWWASIAIVNILTRTITMPILLLNQRNTAKMMALNLELLPLKKLQEAINKAHTREHQMVIHNAWVKRAEEVRLKEGSKLGGIMGTMFGTLMLNSVVFISIFNGVSNLMNAKAPSLSTGGLLWFTDLTLPDPYYGLPVLCTMTTLAMIQYGMNVTGEQMTTPDKAEQANRVKNIFRGMALLFIPFGHFVPSGVALLWASNSAFSVLLGMALRQDGIRRAVGLPTMMENFALGEKLQALNAADPLSFAPPPPPPPPPPADGVVSQGGISEKGKGAPQYVAPSLQVGVVSPPPPAGWAPPTPAPPKTDGSV